MTGEPPFEAGADHETVIWLGAGVTVTLVGAEGGVAGVAGEEAIEGELVPAALEAVTVKV